jgi:hypothetical protein
MRGELQQPPFNLKIMYEGEYFINYEIGASYIYPMDLKKTVFKLKEVRGWVFYFECGHLCMDSVFMDLINIQTGVQVYKDVQVKIF